MEKCKWRFLANKWIERSFSIHFESPSIGEVVEGRNSHVIVDLQILFRRRAMEGDGQETTKKDKTLLEKLQNLLECGCLPLGLKREGRLFVKVTAMHGIRRVWETKGIPQKIFWIFALLACFGVMVALITLNIREFMNDEGSVKVKHTVRYNGMRLPKITFCNNHPIKRSYVTQHYNSTGNLTQEVERYILLSNRDPMMIRKSVQELYEQQDKFQHYVWRTGTDFTFRGFFNKTGFKCEDLFKRCSFAGEEFNCCDNKQFSTSPTEFGLCHSITIEQDQTTETENGGLQLILDAQADDAVPMPIDASQILKFTLNDGFRIFLEDSHMHSYRSSKPISVAPGQSIYSGIQFTQYALESGCTSDGKGVQVRECRSKCIAELYNRTCQCAPLVFDIHREYKTCNPMNGVNCTKNEEMKKALKNNTECSHCEADCTKYNYQSYNSYGGPLSQEAVNALKELYPDNSTTYISKNFVVVSIYYRELSSLVYSSEVVTPSIVSLLSSIGGSAGLCLGFSALTVIEVIVLLIKAVRYWYHTCSKKEDRDKKGKDYEVNRQAEHIAMEVLRKQCANRPHTGGGDNNEDAQATQSQRAHLNDTSRRSTPANMSPAVSVNPEPGHQELAPNLSERSRTESNRSTRRSVLGRYPETPIGGEIGAGDGNGSFVNIPLSDEEQ